MLYLFPFLAIYNYYFNAENEKYHFRDKISPFDISFLDGTVDSLLICKCPGACNFMVTFLMAPVNAYFIYRNDAISLHLHLPVC